MDKKKKRRKDRQPAPAISTVENQRSVKEAEPWPVVEDGRTTKEPASVDVTRPDEEIRLMQETEPVAEVVPEETSPDVKEQSPASVEITRPDDGTRLVKESEPVAKVVPEEASPSVKKQLPTSVEITRPDDETRQEKEAEPVAEALPEEPSPSVKEQLPASVEVTRPNDETRLVKKSKHVAEVAPNEPSWSAKKQLPASVEAPRPDDETRLVKDAKPVPEALPEEPSPSVKKQLPASVEATNDETRLVKKAKPVAEVVPQKASSSAKKQLPASVEVTRPDDETRLVKESKSVPEALPEEPSPSVKKQLPASVEVNRPDDETGLVKKAKPAAEVVPQKSSSSAKKQLPTSVEVTRPDDKTRLGKEAKPVVEALPEEPSPSVKKQLPASVEETRPDEETRLVKKAKPVAEVVPQKASLSAKKQLPASVEVNRPDDETRLVKEAKPVARAVPEEAMPIVKERPDNLLALTNPVDTQPPAAASPTNLQERLFTEDKIPMVASLATSKAETHAEKPKVGKVTGVRLLVSWQPQKTAAQGTDLTTIYGNGYLQYTALFIAMISEFALIGHNLLHNVVAPNVDHWCKQPPQYLNMTSEEWRDISAPPAVSGVRNRCYRYEPPLSVASSNRSKVPCQEWDYEQGSGSSIITEWNLVCDRRWLLTLAYVSYMCGAMVSAPIAGKFSDEVGRRPVICVSAVILVISGMAVCFTTTFAAFTVMRVFVAASLSGIRVTSVVLLFELTPSEYQCLYCVLAVGTGLILAPPFLGVLHIFKANWILAQALVMLPTSLLTCALYVTSESPRWLISKAKYEDVQQALLWAAKMNGVSVNETKKQWRSLWDALRQVDAQVSARGKSGLRGILSSSTLLRRTVILSFVWFIAIVAYYARFHTRRTVSLWLLGACLGLKISSFFIMYQFLTRLGSRLMLCVVFAGSSLIFGCATLLTELRLFPAIVEVMHSLCDVLMDINITLIFTYSAELFPTEVRNIGVCAAYFFGRIGSVLAPVIFELARTEELLAMSAIGVLTALVVLLLPDTKSCAIVDTIKDMDEKHRQETLARLGEHFKGPAPSVTFQAKISRKLKSYNAGQRR